MCLLIHEALSEGYMVVNFHQISAMPFAFCTREKHPWLEFAESAETGPTTQFLKEVRFAIMFLFPREASGTYKFILFSINPSATQRFQNLFMGVF